MPFQIIKKNNSYAVETKGTHHKHGWTTKPKAEAQKRLLEMIMKRKGEK